MALADFGKGTMKPHLIIALLFFCLLLSGCQAEQLPELTLPPKSTSTPAPVSVLPLPSTTTPATTASFTPLPTDTLTPTKPSPLVLLKYPDLDNCTIQVDTEKWTIADLWKKNIVGREQSVSHHTILISNKYLVYLGEHKLYPGCRLAWAPAVGFEDTQITQTFESINNLEWEIWTTNFGTKVYFWTELREIRFMQNPPVDVSQQPGCTTDVYEILASLSCN